ncbi:PREDICTED: putative ABC1 protein At2g40090 [Prunus mume]|uniref:ABC1 protein At2g40090 n=1 Tax=Prunus mume TaxID=102107 RepID=A0ABM0PGU3_PRUMU|nr:PREDICTED: putative ABC1 protein At2g40090 [Prunus mume]
MYFMQFSETFAEMMFKHGFVHCDPHAANLLVRPLPYSGKSILGKKKPQFILLDLVCIRILRPELTTLNCGRAAEVAVQNCRSARKLQELCFSNGGIYIRLGQHLGRLTTLFDGSDSYHSEYFRKALIEERGIEIDVGESKIGSTSTSKVQD